MFRYIRQPAMGAASAVDCFQVYYDDTEEEEWFSYPEPSLVFNASKPETARVSASRLAAARQQYPHGV